MAKKVDRVNCDVGKKKYLRLFGQVRRVPEERVAKIMCKSAEAGASTRGWLPVTWEGIVEQYMGETIDSVDSKEANLGILGKPGDYFLVATVPHPRDGTSWYSEL